MTLTTCITSLSYPCNLTIRLETVKTIFRNQFSSSDVSQPAGHACLEFRWPPQCDHADLLHQPLSRCSGLANSGVDYGLTFRVPWHVIEWALRTVSKHSLVAMPLVNFEALAKYGAVFPHTAGALVPSAGGWIFLVAAPPPWGFIKAQAVSGFSP